MKLTTKGRYAVTAMLDLALHDTEAPVCLSEIATRQDISLPYLEQLFTRLRRTGLIASTRGPGGGYNLGKAPEQVSVADIIRAVDESFDATRCGGKRDCHAGRTCLTHELWESLSDEIDRFLSGVTLAQLIRSQAVRVAAEQSAERKLVFATPRKRASRR
ncbi:MAG TPA: Rrf2 family transcriptional regulator [Gammaproteobacteria bacterium]|jgi:Rrf2 family iron-sulfur cluster assembly transcriptional regulator|nr:Rrf2 family transcriptional regulator [Gammaproteobacteria bacterium]